MINSRDSYTDLSPNRKESIEVPYRIGTIVELKDNPDVLARINQYRITVEDYRQVINVGLNTDIYENEDENLREITVEELEENWKKADRIIVSKIDSDNCLQIPKREKRLKLAREKGTIKS